MESEAVVVFPIAFAIQRLDLFVCLCISIDVVMRVCPIHGGCLCVESEAVVVIVFPIAIAIQKTRLDSFVSLSLYFD